MAILLTKQREIATLFMRFIGVCKLIIQRNFGAMSYEVQSTEVDIAPQFREMTTMQSPIHPIKECGNLSVFNYIKRREILVSMELTCYLSQWSHLLHEGAIVSAISLEFE